MLIIQLTGLSGSGKTTLSNNVKQSLAAENLKTEIIDGDVYRKTLCKDLGFSKEDRCENIRRLGRAAGEFADNVDVVIIAAINPFEDMREELKQQYKAKIVWIKCAVDELVNRDTKGLYKRALLPDGHPDKLYNFTGINDEYNEPVDYDLVLNTDAESIEDSTGRLFHWVIELLGH